MHKKLKTLISSPALQQIQGISASTEPEYVYNKHVIEYTCKIPWYTIYLVMMSLLGIIGFISFNSRKLKLFKGNLFSNAVKEMLFLSDAQYYVTLKLFRTAGRILLFKITGKLTTELIDTYFTQFLQCLLLTNKYETHRNNS